MVNNYLKKARYRIFPEIKNWSGEHDDLRIKKVNDMRWIEWFWFHPSAFTLMKLGIPIIGITHFGAAAAFIYWYTGNIFGTVLFSILTAYCLYILFKAKKELKIAKNMNFYDLHLRDYEIRLN